MRYPKSLQPGGTIGFVAPSFGCNMEPYKTAFLNAQEKFKSLGYRMDLGPNCYMGCGIGISNTPAKCAEEINEYYISKENDILISCGGGELMCEILPYIDFDALGAAEPKWYMGFSDNTNLTFLLATICDTASIYGPCAAAFGMEPWHKSLHDAMDILTGRVCSVSGYDGWERESLKDEEHPLIPYHITEPRILKVQPAASRLSLSDGIYNGPEISFCGRLIGGCMDCLVNLLGTRFDKVAEFAERYREDGIIWFLEACDLNVMSIRRAMWQMEQAGWFKYVKGFIFGRPVAFGEEMMGMNHYNAVYEIASRYNVPVIMDADIGHMSPMMPLICGSRAQVRVSGNDINIDMFK